MNSLQLSRFVSFKMENDEWNLFKIGFSPSLESLRCAFFLLQLCSGLVICIQKATRKITWFYAFRRALRNNKKTITTIIEISISCLLSLVSLSPATLNCFASCFFCSSSSNAAVAVLSVAFLYNNRCVSLLFLLFQNGKWREKERETEWEKSSERAATTRTCNRAPHHIAQTFIHKLFLIVAVLAYIHIVVRIALTEMNIHSEWEMRAR